MDIDEDDDFYGTGTTGTGAEDTPAATAATAAASPDATNPPETKTEDDEEDLEEGEEEDEGGAMDEDDSDDSSIDIITERPDGTQAAPPSQSRYNNIKDIPQRSISTDTTVKAPPIKRESSMKANISSGPSGADYPPVRTSTVDVNAIPTHKGTGKPLTQVNIDQDLPENDKPWRKPGTDLSDYFNYGFDEFTWALYASKQETLRGEFSQEAVARNNKKMMEDMQNMMMMGSMPGMPVPGAPVGGGGSGNTAGAAPGMEGMAPEVHAMMQQLMANGMDPGQMDSSMFAGMLNGGGAGAAGQGGQGQNFGGAGFGGNQGQGAYGGYDQGGGMGNANRGGFNRGRGGRQRNW